jgi:hypothetical protein
MGDLLLSNGAVNRLCQQYKLCFPSGPRKVDIRQSSSETSSSGVWNYRMSIEIVQWRTTDLACEKKTLYML